MPNAVWSMDVVSDALASGRRLKCLTVTDDFTHEPVDITVDHGISGAYVIRVLDQAARFRGYPRTVRTDNGLGVHQPGLKDALNNSSATIAQGSTDDDDAAELRGRGTHG